MKYDINKYINNIADNEYYKGQVDVLEELEEIVEKIGASNVSGHTAILISMALKERYRTIDDFNSQRKFDKQINDLMKL